MMRPSQTWGLRIWRSVDILVLTLEIYSIGVARAPIDTGSTNNLIRASKIGHMTLVDWTNRLPVRYKNWDKIH